MNLLVLGSRDEGVAPTIIMRVESIVGATPSSRFQTTSSSKPHSNALRKGRVSLPNQIYLITTVTQNRIPVFKDFYTARRLVQVLQTEQHAQTLAFVVMPDHLHWLMQLGEQRNLPQIVQRIKSISARKIGKSIWQAGYHDHALRKEEDVQAMARYIVANPLRAGLVERIGDYPHWDAIWLCD